MQSDQPTNSTPKAVWLAGWVFTILTTLLFTFSAVMKFVQPPGFAEGFAKFDYPAGSVIGIGIVELICTALYVIPQTAVLGAILLTGYLGGATATHLRVGDPYWAPEMIGVVVWLGLFLRDARLRALIPFRR